MSSLYNRLFGGNPSNSSARRTQTITTNAISNGVQNSSPSMNTLVLDLQPWIPAEFNRDNIRLVVFFDSDDGLKLIFDSKTLRIVQHTENENIHLNSNRAVPSRTTDQSINRPPTGTNSSRLRPVIQRFTHNGRQYELLKASNDIRTYADYIFGVMPLVFKGTGMKVHTSKSPLQIMMSRVFPLKLPDRIDSTNNNVQRSCEPESAPVNPLGSLADFHIQRSMSSGVSVASSTISSIDALSEDLTNQKFGRLYRRWLKCANRSMRQPIKQPGRRHRRCIGAAFIISFGQNETSKYRHFEEFFCTHAPLIENHFQKIMNAAETHINEPDAVASILLDKLFVFREELYTLYTRPRLIYPAWYLFTQEQLSMSKRRLLAKQLCSIIDVFSSNKYGTFLNCVLSAVLSHQLSWLSTVSPSLIKSKQQVLFKSKAEYANALQSFLQYSPLWGQLVDLFSAYGQPAYICRTVIIGKDSTLLNALVYLLTFFIRPSYLTYNIPNSKLSDVNDEQNRTFKKIRLYIDELIANSMTITDIEPFSSASSEDEDIEILSNDESERQNFNENSSLADEITIRSILESIINRVDQMVKLPTFTPTKQSKKANIATVNKTLMSLSLFEPNQRSNGESSFVNDYHVDLGLSLISSSSSTYSSDFVLQAVQTSNSQAILRQIFSQHVYDMSENGCLFLNGERIESSKTIFINIDDHSVNIYSSKTHEIGIRQEKTKFIQAILDHSRLTKHILPADFVLLNMEDSLQEIYFQALAMLKYIRANTQSIYNSESTNAFADSMSNFSENDDQRSLTTNNTVTDLTKSLIDYSYASSLENNVELVQNLRKIFQLEKADICFMKNILRILEIEQREMNG